MKKNLQNKHLTVTAWGIEIERSATGDKSRNPGGCHG